MSEISKDYIEEIIDENIREWCNYRKFMITKYNNREYTLDCETDRDSFSMNINYCPLCGNKLE